MGGKLPRAIPRAAGPIPTARIVCAVVAATHLSITLLLTSNALTAPLSVPRYSIVGLGTLGGPTSVALDINELGQVVGSADLPNGLRRGFLWENGTMTDLGTLESVQQSEAWAINNVGQVVVNATDFGDPQRAFVWYQGTQNEIGYPFTPKFVSDINDRGQIVGNMGPSSNPLAFLFDQGAFLDLGTLGGPYSKAWEINEAGQIAGGSSTGPAEHAFLWESGVMSDLGTLGGENSEAFAINDLGQITGWAQPTLGDFLYNVFVWTSGVMERIGPDHYARGEGINRHGLVVLEGYLVDTATNSTWALAELIPTDSGWSDLSPRSINDLGEIVGDGTYQGSRVAFLMRDLTTSTLASLVSAEAESDHTRLVWRVVTRSRVAVDRRDGDMDWTPVGESFTENDRIRFEDHDVQPGRRYGYRLRWLDADGREVTAGEAWLDVPLRSRLALLGAWPNPARDQIPVAFTLPAPGEVVIDLYDVTGRRAETSGPRFLPSGFHMLPLGGSLAPGVYVARLAFGDRRLETRVVKVQ